MKVKDTEAGLDMSVNVILCTVPKYEVARNIALALVENNIAACVNIVPSVTSVYRWEGKTETDQECQLLIKTTAEKVEQAYLLVKSQHPYDVPEWLVIPNVDGSPEYLRWIQNQTRQTKDGPRKLIK
ncbi:divalent-cation tolerance protein CutA [Alteromonas pelagimontana]|nr:divalent-cation tolerance protein CutA [Alteromonas pelagimontana]